MVKRSAVMLLFIIAMLPLSAHAQPVAPHTPAAAIMRAHALIALRMVEAEVGQELYLVETDGADYTVILRDAGVEAVRRSGRYHILSLPDRFGILVSVTSSDGGEVACRIFDGDGKRIVEDDGGMVAQCEVR